MNTKYYAFLLGLVCLARSSPLPANQTEAQSQTNQANDNSQNLTKTLMRPIFSLNNQVNDVASTLPHVFAAKGAVIGTLLAVPIQLSSYAVTSLTSGLTGTLISIPIVWSNVSSVQSLPIVSTPVNQTVVVAHHLNQTTVPLPHSFGVAITKGLTSLGSSMERIGSRIIHTGNRFKNLGQSLNQTQAGDSVASTNGTSAKAEPKQAQEVAQSNSSVVSNSVPVTSDQPSPAVANSQLAENMSTDSEAASSSSKDVTPSPVVQSSNDTSVESRTEVSNITEVESSQTTLNATKLSEESNEQETVDQSSSSEAPKTSTSATPQAMPVSEITSTKTETLVTPSPKTSASPSQDSQSTPGPSFSSATTTVSVPVESQLSETNLIDQTSFEETPTSTTNAPLTPGPATGSTQVN